MGGLIALASKFLAGEMSDLVCNILGLLILCLYSGSFVFLMTKSKFRNHMKKDIKRILLIPKRLFTHLFCGLIGSCCLKIADCLQDSDKVEVEGPKEKTN